MPARRPPFVSDRDLGPGPLRARRPVRADRSPTPLRPPPIPMNRSTSPRALAAVLLVLAGACRATAPEDPAPRPASAAANSTGGSSAPASNARGAADATPGTTSNARRDDAPPTTSRYAGAPLALADAIEVGLQHNANLRARHADWRAAVERADATGTLPDPRLHYAEFLEDLQTRTGPQERRFGVSQAFPWPGTLGARERVAAREADAAFQRAEAERLRVAADVAVAFHDHAFLGSERAVTHELLELVRGLEPVVQSRVRAGGGQEDLLRLQVEIGRLEDDVARLDARLSASSARLADAMGLVVDGPPLPTPALREPDFAVRDVDALYADAVERDPRLLELVARREAGREREALVGYERRPDFSVGFDYFQTGDALDPSTPGSGEDPYLVKLSFSLPVWRSSYDAEERAARQVVRATSERIAAARTALRAEVEEQWFRVEDALRRARLYRESLVPRAGESLDLTLSSYRAGSASVLDLIDSERALLEFQLSYARACRDALQGYARLQALTGGEL